VKQGEVYVCTKCGTEIQVLRDSNAVLLCCGQAMVPRAPYSR